MKSIQYSWDASAQSTGILTGDGGYTFKVGQAVGIYCGLNNINTTSHYSDIKHAFRFNSNYCYVVDFGTTQLSWNYASNATFGVFRRGNYIDYTYNGEVVHTTPNATLGPLFLDCSILGENDSIIDATLVEDNGAVSTFPELRPLRAYCASYDSESIDFSIASVYLGALEVTSEVYTACTCVANLCELEAKTTSELDEVTIASANLRPLSTSIFINNYTPDIVDLYGYIAPLAAKGFDDLYCPFTNHARVELSPLSGKALDAEDILCFADLHPLTAHIVEETRPALAIVIPSIQITLDAKLDAINATFEYFEGHITTEIGAKISGLLPLLQGTALTGGELDGDILEFLGVISANSTTNTTISGAFQPLSGSTLSGSDINTSFEPLRGTLSAHCEPLSHITGSLPTIEGLIRIRDDVEVSISGNITELLGSTTLIDHPLARITAHMPFLSGGLETTSGDASPISGFLPYLSGVLYAAYSNISISANLEHLSGTIHTLPYQQPQSPTLRFNYTRRQ